MATDCKLREVHAANASKDRELIHDRQTFDGGQGRCDSLVYVRAAQGAGHLLRRPKAARYRKKVVRIEDAVGYRAIAVPLPRLRQLKGHIANHALQERRHLKLLNLG